MRFVRFCNLTLLALLLSACCGNLDPSATPCYEEWFGTTKEEQQKEDYQLESKRAPRFNR